MSLILGTRFEILGTRIGSLKCLKKPWPIDIIFLLTFLGKIKVEIIIIIMIFYCGLMVHITDTRAQKVVGYTSPHITETVFAHDQHWEDQSSLSSPEMSGLWNFSVRVQSWSDNIESDPVLIRKIFENHQSDPVQICQCKIMYFYFASWGRRTTGAILPLAKYD